MIRRYLLVGCFALLPLVVTVWVVRMIFSFLVDVFLGPLTWASLQMELKPPPYWQIALISIVGTILYFEAEGRDGGDMAALLAARDRRLAGPTAPARGLFLWSVDYYPEPRRPGSGAERARSYGEIRVREESPDE